MFNDLRAAYRAFVREPGQTAAAILTMALGIGAATTLFSVTYGVLLRPLPWPEPDRIVRLSETRGGRSGRVPGTISNATYLAWRDHPTTIEDVAAWSTSRVTLAYGGESTRIDSAAITEGLFPLLRAQPIRGRAFTAEDAADGVPHALLLSYGLWQQRFGGSDDVIGRPVQVDGRALTIVGVMSPGFAFPDRTTHAWIARAIAPVVGEQGVRRGSIMSALARLVPGATLQQASAEGTARAVNGPDLGMVAQALFGSNGPVAITASPMADAMTADVRPALLLLFAAVGLLLLAAIGNVAGLQMARATVRRRELAIRAALGAASSRLARLMIAESAALTFVGGAIGIGLSWAAHSLLPVMVGAQVPRLDAVVLDLPVASFAIAVTAVAAIACGVWPALQARDGRLLDIVAEGGRTTAGSGWAGRGGRARVVLMTVQVALASVLLFGTAVVAQSLLTLIRADRGFAPQNLLTAQVPFPPGYPEERKAALRTALLDRLTGTPGVRDAAFGTALPFVSAGGFAAFTFRSPLHPDTEVPVEAARRIVTPGYFGALGLRIAAGRALAATDRSGSTSALVVNRTFVRRYLDDIPVARAVGLRVDGGNLRLANDAEIVGVVDDVRQDRMDDPEQAEIYMSYAQVTGSLAGFDTILAVRTADSPAVLAPTLRALLREADPSLTFDSVMTMEDRVATSLARPRLYAMLLGTFGLGALVIVGVGLFGVLSFGVAQRARELAVRIAVGATPRQVLGTTLGSTALVAIAGVGLGSLIGWSAVSRFSELLFGTSPAYGTGFMAAGAMVTLVSIVASLVPARRIIGLDPVGILKADQ